MALSPVRLAGDAIIGILERQLELAEARLRRAAIAQENMAAWPLLQAQGIQPYRVLDLPSCGSKSTMSEVKKVDDFKMIKRFTRQELICKVLAVVRR